MLALIDNYDSFTYNLAQYFSELGAEIKVYRNDELDSRQLAASKPQAIIISPGPCTPNEAGISMEVTRELALDFPIFGVCLGMQAMVQAYGGSIVAAEEIMHGKLTRIFHKGDPVFASMDNPFVATRYNSLTASESDLPSCFAVIAWSYVGDVVSDTEAVQSAAAAEPTAKTREIMGVRHKELNMVGVQFHPESIMTRQGKFILQNFLASV